MSRKNLLMIHCHDLGKHLPVYGQHSVVAPNLEQFSSEGITFNNCFCTAPGCSPSRASIFTGCYPHQVGVLGLTSLQLGGRFNAYDRHLARVMADAGFMTALIGIMHEAEPVPETPPKLGYEYFNGKFGMCGSDVSAEATSFIENYRDERPFFLSVGFREPHHPWHNGECRDKGVDIPGWVMKKNYANKDIPPERIETDFALIQGAVRELDKSVGEILRSLKKSGLDRDTVVVFTTDHGIAMPRAKCTLYDPGIEVSLMIRDPDSKAGTKINSMVSNIDIYPTLLELFGLKLPGDIPGRSLCRCLEGNDRGREAIFAEKNWHSNYDPIRCVRTGKYKFIANFENNMSGGLVETEHPLPDTYIRFRKNFELYDLENDPYEREDLADNPDFAEAVKDMKKQLVTFMKGSDDPLLKGPIPGYFYLDTMRKLDLSGD